MAIMDLPNPIIFGSQRPQIRLRIERGKQHVYSIGNYNLYIDEWDINKEGTFTIGALYKNTRLSVLLGATPLFVHQNDLTLPECNLDQPYAMLTESVDEFPLLHKQHDVDGLGLTKIGFFDRPKLFDCRLLSTLLGSVNAPAEKRFAEFYYTWAICGADVIAGGWEILSLKTRYGDFIKSWHDQQLHMKREYRNAAMVTEIIQTSLRAPALIPQVWLNYTYDPSQLPAKETIELKGMPKRVDFVFIRENKLHIVEIDDPSHYAIYDESKKRYEVSEEKYTNNLKAERALREQGFEIHRLSNWEILNATEPELLDLIRDALGIAVWQRDSPKVDGTFFNDKQR